MARLTDMPVEVVDLILQFLFADVQIDCDKGYFRQRLRQGAPLFSILEVEKGLFTTRQVQNAMLMSSVIYVYDTWDVVNMDRFLDSAHQRLIRMIHVPPMFLKTANLKVFYSGSYNLFSNLSVLEIDPGVSDLVFLVEHGSEIFDGFEADTEHIRQHIDSTCVCRGYHGPRDLVHRDTRTAKHIEQALRRSNFNYLSLAPASLCIYSILFGDNVILFDEEVKARRVSELADMIEQATLTGVEIRLDCSATVMVDLGADFSCGCEWNLHDASFSSRDKTLRLRLGDEDIRIPQRFRKRAPATWQRRTDDLGDDYSWKTPSWVDNIRSRSELIDGPSPETLKRLERAWEQFRGSGVQDIA